MSAAPFLALLAIAMLPGAALRLELNFRRTARRRPAVESRPERRNPRPELRMSPAGGYGQAPLSAAALRNG
jgi:hypothetical protein